MLGHQITSWHDIVPSDSQIVRVNQQLLSQVSCHSAAKIDARGSGVCTGISDHNITQRHTRFDLNNILKPVCFFKYEYMPLITAQGRRPCSVGTYLASLLSHVDQYPTFSIQKHISVPQLLS